MLRRFRANVLYLESEPKSLNTFHILAFLCQNVFFVLFHVRFCPIYLKFVSDSQLEYLANLTTVGTQYEDIHGDV